MARMIFTNLPVADVAASRAFYGALGFEFNEAFCDDSTACMVVSDQACVMLLERERFADFTAKPVGQPAESTSAIICYSADSREDVDAFADGGLAAGGTPAKDPQDFGFMYGRSFYDLDGHHVEIMYMDMAAMETATAEA